MMKKAISTLSVFTLFTALLFTPVLAGENNDENSLVWGAVKINNVLEEGNHDQFDVPLLTTKSPTLLQISDECIESFSLLINAEVYEIDLNEEKSLSEYMQTNEPLEWEDAEYITRTYNDSLNLPRSGYMDLTEPGHYLLNTSYELTLLTSGATIIKVKGEKPVDEQVVDPEPVEETPPIDVTVDGELLEMDVAPVIEEGRTLVPMRAIFERLGAHVSWDEDTRTVTGVKDDTTIELTLGDTEALVDGLQVEIDVPADTIEGRTMVPTRFIAETLGAYVAWDEENRTVIVESN